MEEEGRLVERGSLRLDRTRALEVLRSRQLADSYWRPLLWFRLGAACGARRFKVKAGMLSVRMEFDGKALSGELLADPLTRLASETKDPAARWLGWALLHTVATGAVVTVDSGSAYEYGADFVSRRVPSRGAGGTAVRVRWPFLTLRLTLDRGHPAYWFQTGEHGAGRLLERLKDADGVPFSLAVRDASVTPWEERDDAYSIVRRRGARRVRVRMAAGPPAMRLWHWGVLAAECEPPLGLPAAQVDVDDPALTLSASLDKAVRDDAYEAAAAAGRAAVYDGFMDWLERHAKSMALLGRLLPGDAALARRWRVAQGLPYGRSRVPWGTGARPFSRPGADRLRAARAARDCVLLRRFLLADLKQGDPSPDETLRLALRATPVAFDRSGRPLTLAELRRPGSDVWSFSPSDRLFLWRLRRLAAPG